MDLKKRIQILLAFLVGVPFLLLLAETYRTGRGTLLRQMRKDASQTARLQAALLESTFQSPRLAAEALARAVACSPSLEPQVLRTLLIRSLQEVEGAYGFALALPEGAGPGKPLVPYVFRSGTQVMESSLEAASYNFKGQEWYARPLAEKRAIWTRPYLDRGGGEVAMITFAVPIVRAGKVLGVATADVSLDRMVGNLRQLRPGGNGHVYLVSRDGAVLAHPKLPALDDPGMAAGIPRIGALQQMLANAGEDAMSAKDPFTHQQAWLVEVPLAPLAAERGGLDWSLVVSWPEDVKLQPLEDLGKRFLVLYLALGGAALLFLNRSMHDLISRPIARLARRARHFAHGDFRDLGHPAEDGAELRELSEAVQLLGNTLKEKAQSREGA